MPTPSLRAIVTLLSLIVLTACGDTTPPPDPVPGPLAYRLVSPNGDEGAALFSLPAGAVTDVAQDPAAAGTRTLFHEDDGVLYVAVIGTGHGEIRFRVEARDTRAPPAITLVEVVDPTNRIRPLAGYSLEVVR